MTKILIQTEPATKDNPEEEQGAEPQLSRDQYNDLLTKCNQKSAQRIGLDGFIAIGLGTIFLVDCKYISVSYVHIVLAVVWYICTIGGILYGVYEVMRTRRERSSMKLNGYPESELVIDEMDDNSVLSEIQQNQKKCSQMLNRDIMMECFSIVSRILFFYLFTWTLLKHNEIVQRGSQVDQILRLIAFCIWAVFVMFYGYVCYKILSKPKS